MLTILLNSENKGMICLDEPETGLHPDMTKSISDVMKDAVYDNYLQIIVATHSPLLLNCFEIEDILIFEKDDKNSSLVSKKISSDFDQWAEGYTLGQLWLMGKLGGKRW
jgi:predicted ATPase